VELLRGPNLDVIRVLYFALGVCAAKEIYCEKGIMLGHISLISR